MSADYTALKSKSKETRFQGPESFAFLEREPDLEEQPDSCVSRDLCSTSQESWRRQGRQGGSLQNVPLSFLTMKWADWKVPFPLLLFAIGRKGWAEEAGQVPGGLALWNVRRDTEKPNLFSLENGPRGLAAYSKALELGADTSRVEPCIELGPCSLSCAQVVPSEHILRCQCLQQTWPSPGPLDPSLPVVGFAQWFSKLSSSLSTKNLFFVERVSEWTCMYDCVVCMCVCEYLCGYLYLYICVMCVLCVFMCICGMCACEYLCGCMYLYIVMCVWCVCVFVCVVWVYLCGCVYLHVYVVCGCVYICVVCEYICVWGMCMCFLVPSSYVPNNHMSVITWTLNFSLDY